MSDSGVRRNSWRRRFFLFGCLPVLFTLTVLLIGVLRDAVVHEAPPSPPDGPPTPQLTPQQRARADAAEQADRKQRANAALDAAKGFIVDARSQKEALIAVNLYDEADEKLSDSRLLGGDQKIIDGLEAVITKARAPLDCKVEGEARRDSVVPMLQEQFYKNGIDATLSTSGNCATSLTIEWALWSGPSVYEFEHGPIIGVVREKGFKKLTLRSWEKYWTYEFGS